MRAPHIPTPVLSTFMAYRDRDRARLRPHRRLPRRLQHLGDRNPLEDGWCEQLGAMLDITVTTPADFLPDGMHFNTGGQTKRAQAAAATLLR